MTLAQAFADLKRAVELEVLKARQGAPSSIRALWTWGNPNKMQSYYDELARQHVYVFRITDAQVQDAIVSDPRDPKRFVSHFVSHSVPVVRPPPPGWRRWGGKRRR